MKNKIEIITRPIDRPILVYCRVCRTYLSDNWSDGTKPSTLINCICSYCKIKGSMLFREVDDLPICGDSECKGTCSNILCYPKDDIKIDDEPNTGTYIPYIIAYSVFLICVGIMIGYYAL